MRRVYPGFLQLAAFMSMNLHRHVKAHVDLHGYLASGEHDRRGRPDVLRRVLRGARLPAEFYLETVERVFQAAQLPLGGLEWRGGRVEPRRDPPHALLTVEGEKDDICAVGQTVAAQDLCTRIRPTMRRHHVQPGAGHYGVFNGPAGGARSTRSSGASSRPAPDRGRAAQRVRRATGIRARARPAVRRHRRRRGGGSDGSASRTGPSIRASARGEPRARAPRD